MSRWFYWFFVAFIIVAGELTCVATTSEDQCIDYYKTGEDFDLNLLVGDWFAVYYWPPLQRQRGKCEMIKFSTINSSEIGCAAANVPSGSTVLKSTYKNSADKIRDVFYYGAEEVKQQIRDCNRVSKYIFIDLFEGYVMGINCSSEGRGILLAKTLPTNEDLQSVVEDIPVMTGRFGSPDCSLAR
ncbi:uncharacterized protein LOC123875717 [Maniola jurtina]|uniref:uncharacterized protein LOC123875716 n=1 Tax=Maniola jurtina TaxID=191418 RepID=UPI001E689F0D|nr:uncharacterized protein LOC123875716 [Maniola jurtina]XP_045777673.1 uncharacterized protein LOC123875717 [Maniola jurtina]